jgi:hypothetical protein
MTENTILSEKCSNEKISPSKKRGHVIRNRWNKMTTIDLIVRKLEENPSKEEKTVLMEEFKKELDKFDSGYLQKFKNTAIYSCFKYHYNFYEKQLTQE